MNRKVILFAAVIIFIAGCREVYSVRELHSSFSPDISRVILKDGKIVTFNPDLGWYNRKAGTIEGITTDSIHVEYHLVEINKVEVVRGYSLIAALFVGGIILGAGIWLIEKLFTVIKV